MQDIQTSLGPPKFGEERRLGLGGNLNFLLLKSKFHLTDAWSPHVCRATWEADHRVRPALFSLLRAEDMSGAMLLYIRV